jgi:hypothetical protein
LKESIRKIVGKLHRHVSDAGSAAKKNKSPRHRRNQGFLGNVTTGRTVFDDRPLRFRSFTLAEPDLSKLAQPATLEGAFKIRVAKHSRSHGDAIALVQRKYAGRGYAIPEANRTLGVMTFIAYDEGRVVGTVGVGLDASRGLAADELYGAELNRLRSAGCRLCEFTRLAVDTTVASKPVLAGLFHVSYLYASTICGRTHTVIEVNPRHVAFYRKELGFEVLGPERLNTRVNAPAVLLCASFETIAHGLSKHAGRSPSHGSRRGLFHHGFPPEEAVGVLERLYELIAPR